MPRNLNLRINLECVDGRLWWFTLHQNSQAHPSTRGYQSAEEAVREALVLHSIMKIKKDSAERRQRWFDGVKSGPVVEASKQTEAVTQPSDDGNI
jgi:hypothetical protein